MEKLKALLPRLIATARWLAFLIIVIASGAVAWKVAGIWQTSMGLFPDTNNAILGMNSPWHPFYTFLLTCFLCVLGAAPMLRERRNLSAPRMIFELVYSILALYVLYTMSEIIFSSIANGSSATFL